MTRPTPAQREKAAKLTKLLPLQEFLTTWVKVYEDAGDIFAGSRRAVKDRVEKEDPEYASVDLAQALARIHPAERVRALATLRDMQLMVRSVIDDLDETIHATPDDLAIVTGVIKNLRVMGTRSKRELCRFIDAVDAGDSVVAVTVYYPDKKKMDARAATAISDESLKAIGLAPMPNPKE